MVFVRFVINKKQKAGVSREFLINEGTVSRRFRAFLNIKKRKVGV